MSEYCFVARNGQGMNYALERINKLYDELQEGFCPGKEYLEILNLATIAREILSAAIARKESVGAHYRED